MTSPNDSQLPDYRLPEAAIRGLKRADQLPFDVTAEEHEQILQSARANLNSSPVTRPGRRWLAVTAVVSSVCAAMLLFSVTRFIQPQPTDNFDVAVNQPGLPEISLMVASPDLDPRDIDENGTVDILDAYALARRLESDDPDGPWDFNSDGQLNEDDVRLVALEAVML